MDFETKLKVPGLLSGELFRIERHPTKDVVPITVFRVLLPHISIFKNKLIGNHIEFGATTKVKYDYDLETDGYYVKIQLFGFGVSFSHQKSY